MPSVVAGALVSSLGFSGIMATVATSLLGGVASAALQSFAARPKSGSKLSSGQRIEMVRSSAAARRVVYGEARLSGPLAFAATTDDGASGKNAYLHLVLPLAGHEVSSIGALYVNDERIEPVALPEEWMAPAASSRFSSPTAGAPPFIQWQCRLGTPDQLALRGLFLRVPGWSEQHRLRGVAYLYAQLYYSSTVWGGGLPNLSALVRGRKVYDPRTGLTGWSDNPALIIRDYLLAPFGLACEADEIDEDSFVAAATLCDERVPVTGGSEQKRYSCNGVFALDEKPIEIVEHLLSSCGGTLVYSEGRYRLYPAAFRTPILSLEAGHLRDEVTVRPLPPRAERPNTMRGTFVDPARGWQQTDFTPVADSTALSADNGLVIARDHDFAFTTDASMAQRLAQIQLRRARHALTVGFPATLAALPVAVMEPLYLTLPQFGWQEKVFTPVAWTLTPEGGIDLELVEDDPALYSWDGGAVLDAALPLPPLPDIYPAAPSLQLHDEVQQGEGGSSLRLVAEVSGVADVFINRIEVEYRRSDETDWHAAGTGTRTVIRDVIAGETYNVRARCHSLIGTTSAWSEASCQIAFASSLPGDVSALVATQVDSTLHLEWSAAGGVVDHYRLRWSPLTSGASWAGAVDVADGIRSTRVALPARSGSYLVKAVDLLGRESDNAALYPHAGSDPRGGVVVATLTEHPAFSGSKSNCSLNVSTQLVIDSLIAFEAQTGLFDSAAGIIDSAGGGAVPEGVYQFTAPVDLGQRYNVRAAAHIVCDVIDLVNDVDAAAGAFDLREGAFDGTAPSAVDVVLEVATTADDPAGASPLWSNWQPLSLGDMVARGLKFRARLLSRNAMATPAVTELKVTLEMAGRVEAGSNILSATGGTSVTFSPAFKDTPALGVTASDLASGDYAVLTAQSRSGFTVQFKNAAGSGVQRHFDWVARGVGREV